MLFKFIFKNIKISYKKFRLLINKIRGFSVLNMLVYLNFLNKKSAFILKKILLSVLSSLSNRVYFNILNFKINKISCEKGIVYKRPFYRSKGRLNIILKRYSNIIIFFSNL